MEEVRPQDVLCNDGFATSRNHTNWLTKIHPIPPRPPLHSTRRPLDDLTLELPTSSTSLLTGNEHP